MSTQKEISLVEQRERLERRANVVRSRLLRTIDALDTRRHQITEIGGHVKRLAVPTVAAVIGVAVATAAAAFAVTRLVRVRRERRLSYRVGHFLSPMFQQKRPSILEDAARKVTVTVLGILASELTKRGAKSFLNGRLPEQQRLLPRSST